MVTVIRPSRARCVNRTIPRHECAVLTAWPPGRAGAARRIAAWGCVLCPLIYKATGASLFDRLVGEHEQRVRNGNAKRPGGLEVDHQLLVIIKGLEDAFLFCSRRAANCRSLTYVRTCREIPKQLLPSCFQREPHSQPCVGGALLLFIFREARRLDFLRDSHRLWLVRHRHEFKHMVTSLREMGRLRQVSVPADRSRPLQADICLARDSATTIMTLNNAITLNNAAARNCPKSGTRAFR